MSSGNRRPYILNKLSAFRCRFASMNDLFLPLGVKGLTTLARCEICSKLIKTSKWRSDVFVVNFEQIPHIFLVFHSWIWESVAGLVYQRQSKGVNIMKDNLNIIKRRKYYETSCKGRYKIMQH